MTDQIFECPSNGALSDCRFCARKQACIDRVRARNTSCVPHDSTVLLKTVRLSLREMR